MPQMTINIISKYLYLLFRCGSISYYNPDSVVVETSEEGEATGTILSVVVAISGSLAGTVSTTTGSAAGIAFGSTTVTALTFSTAGLPALSTPLYRTKYVPATLASTVSRPVVCTPRF